MVCARALALLKAGRRRPARMAMMAMTTSSSIRVKAGPYPRSPFSERLTFQDRLFERRRMATADRFQSGENLTDRRANAKGFHGGNTPTLASSLGSQDARFEVGK